jgi:integrase/recombinase XerD
VECERVETVALGTALRETVPVETAPVEYAVAVEDYLGQAGLSAASRRVYRISLSAWAWPLVGRPVPGGRERHGATPPVVPLALLDDPAAPSRLAAALAERVLAADARTVNRELSALRGAIGWWRERGWIRTDPVAGLRHRKPEALAPPLTDAQVADLFRLPVSLREHTFWRLLHDTGAPAAEILALNADRLDLARHRLKDRPGHAGAGRDGGMRRDVGMRRGEVAHAAGVLDTDGTEWQESTSQALRWLLAGRTWGPVFVTTRRAPRGTPRADLCGITGQARMSYRRAAEIFTAATAPLDPAGRGWTLHQLSSARQLASTRRALARIIVVYPKKLTYHP